MAALNKCPVIRNIAIHAGVLQQDTEIFTLRQARNGVSDYHFNIKMSGTVEHHIARLRQRFFIDQETMGFCLAVDAQEHGHRFRCGRCLVQQGSIGYRHRRQITNHLLKVEQGFQSPLRDFCLIGRVGRVPTGIFEDISLDDRRHDGVVVAHANHAVLQPIQRRHFLQPLQRFQLVACAWQVQRFLEMNGGGQGCLDQLLQRVCAHYLQHVLHLLIVRPDVTGHELTVIFQVSQW
jgi:hypothetical protein